MGMFKLVPNNYMNKPFMERLAQTVYIVEASNFEQHILWSEFSKEGEVFTQTPLRKRPRETWEQITPGEGCTFGERDGQNMMVMFSWVKLNGQLIAFYNATSQLVDYAILEEWLNHHMPHLYPAEGHESRHHYTDAQNFHQALHHVDALNKSKEEALAVG